MKIGLVSDLHSEFWKGSDHDTITEVVQRRLADADLILLAGDLGLGNSSLHLAGQLFVDRPVCMVAGNHEFYQGDYDTVLTDLQTSANVHFLHKTILHLMIDDQPIRVIGTTLWTDFDLHGNAALAALDAQVLNDFRLITYRNRKLRPRDTLEWHHDQRQWLFHELDKPFDGTTIVMTHHAPVSFAIAPRFQGDHLSPCFASRLDNLLIRPDVALVVWGHTHHCVDRTIDSTRFVSNQTGYPGWVVSSTLPTETGEFGQVIDLR